MCSYLCMFSKGLNGLWVGDEWNNMLKINIDVIKLKVYVLKRIFIRQQSVLFSNLKAFRENFEVFVPISLYLSHLSRLTGHLNIQKIQSSTKNFSGLACQDINEVFVFGSSTNTSGLSGGMQGIVLELGKTDERSMKRE